LLRQLGSAPDGRVGATVRVPPRLCRASAHGLGEDGVDIHARLPVLSAYLGHQNIIGTEVYLKATPQLLELASNRFEQHLRGARPPR
jgi:hypothetical protein